MSSFKDWTKVLELVERLAGCERVVKFDDKRTKEALLAIKQIEQMMGGQPVLITAATWRKLLAKQVPKQLAAASVSALTNILPAFTSTSTSTSTRTTSSSSSSSGGGGASRGSNSIDATLAAFICSRVLQVLTLLVGKAVDDLGIRDVELEQRAAPRQTATVFQQQMISSGLIQFLPQLFSSLVGQMQTELHQVGAIGQLKLLLQSPQGAQPDSQQQQVLQGPSAGSSSTARDGDAGSDATDMLNVVSTALCLFKGLQKSWPHNVFVRDICSPECAPAVMQLACMMMPYLSQQLPLPGTALSDLPHLTALAFQWRAASEAAFSILIMNLGNTDDPRASSEADAVVAAASPAGMLCTVQLLLVHSYTALLAQLPDSRLPSPADRAGGVGPASSADSSSSGGNGSGSGSSGEQQGQGSSSSSTTTTSRGGSSGARNRANRSRANRRISTWANRWEAGVGAQTNAYTASAWELACREVGNLAVTHRLLAEQMGCSPVAFLYVAARMKLDYFAQVPGPEQQQQRTEIVETVLEGLQLTQSVYMEAIERMLAAAAACEERGEDPAAVVFPIEQRQLHLLLSSALMYWAAHQPLRVGGGQQAANCGLAVECALHALQAAVLGKDGVPQLPLPDWLLHLVQAEVAPLAAAVGAVVLRTLGCDVANIGTASTTAAAASSSSSGPKHTTASSTKPALTAQHLVEMLLMLDGAQAHVVLVGQLLEASVRDWLSVEHSRLEYYIWSVHNLLVGMISAGEGDDGSGSDNVGDSDSGSVGSGSGSVGSSSSSSSGAQGGVLLAAAQQHPQPTSSSSSSSNQIMPPDQTQLASLCFSVLKLVIGVRGAHPAAPYARLSLLCCKHAAEAANSMLCWLAASEAGTSPEGTSNSAQQAVAAAVPWLVLCGRVLLCVAPWLPAATAAASSLDTPSPEEAPSEDDEDDWELLQYVVDLALSGLWAWLEAEGAADALSAAGYDPSGSLLQQLRAVCGAGEEDSSGSASTATSQLQPAALLSLGASLNTLPFACACNNPGCTNLSGPLELQLVRPGAGRNSLCSGCCVARYCSPQCSKQHWKQHRPVCCAVAAASKDAGAATPAAQGAEGAAGSAPAS